MRKKFRIALAQIKYFDLHKKHNVMKIKSFIQSASKKKAEIVCFPETCITKHADLHYYHRYLTEIREECRKNRIWCIISDNLVHQGQVHKVAILIDHEGKIRGKYKKINLYGESKEVLPGKKIGVFKTDFAKIGIVVCWDLAFPRLFHSMRLAGAQIVFCPAKWAYEQKAHNKEHQKRELKLLKALIQARAFENLYFVAVCNPYQGQKDLVCYSAIACPHRILKEILNREGLLVAEVDLREIQKFRKLYPGK